MRENNSENIRHKRDNLKLCVHVFLIFNCKEFKHAFCLCMGIVFVKRLHGSAYFDLVDKTYELCRSVGEPEENLPL